MNKRMRAVVDLMTQGLYPVAALCPKEGKMADDDQAPRKTQSQWKKLLKNKTHKEAAVLICDESVDVDDVAMALRALVMCERDGYCGIK